MVYGRDGQIFTCTLFPEGHLALPCHPYRPLFPSLLCRHRHRCTRQVKAAATSILHSHPLRLHPHPYRRQAAT